MDKHHRAILAYIFLLTGASLSLILGWFFGEPVHFVSCFVFLASLFLLVPLHDQKNFVATVTDPTGEVSEADVFIPELIEGAISRSSDLGFALNRIVEMAIKKAQAESVEIALFDKEHGRYHSSIVIGQPFPNTIDDYISGKIDQVSSVHLEPICFAGTVLGALRLAGKDDRPLGDEKKKLVRLLALQAAIAIVNSDYLSELFKMREHAQASQKARTGFLANLSHELRGPLGVVLNAAEMVRDELCGPLNEEQREMITMIQKNGKHLLELLNDVLDYARIESGKISSQAEAISTHDLFLDIISVIKSQAEMKHHTMTVEEGPDLRIRCDRRHIRQIMINLLTNAIKYTPERGAISVGAEVIRGAKVKVWVKDTGIGIASVNRDKVFTAFERIDNSYTRREIGTGLGMPLTKKLLELNNGTIDFESVPDKGSTFFFTLPLSNEAIEILPKELVPISIKGEAREVLFIGSQNEERTIITKYLREHNFSVIEATTIRDAARELKGKRYAIVLIDDSAIRDLGGNPIQALRDELFGVGTPIVLMSDEAFSFNVEDHLRSGIDRHITRPASLHEIASICLDLSKHEERLLKNDARRKEGPGGVIH